MKLFPFVFILIFVSYDLIPEEMKLVSVDLTLEEIRLFSVNRMAESLLGC